MFGANVVQGIASAPIWDSSDSSVIGVLSASDFITILRRLRSSVSSGANPMSEIEMDAHTIRCVAEAAAAAVTLTWSTLTHVYKQLDPALPCPALPVGGCGKRRHRRGGTLSSSSMYGRMMTCQNALPTCSKTSAAWPLSSAQSPMGPRCEGGGGGGG